MFTSKIRPGLLVSVKTSVTGDVTYSKQTIVPDHAVEGTERRVAEWNTVRTILDADEFEASRKVRSEAIYTVGRVCASTAFGYLCPEDKVSELEAAIAEARSKIDGFNATARLSRVSFYVITGRVARDDVEAIRAISAEVRDLISAMAAGVESLDASKVRDAANRARQISAMLSDDAQQKVAAVIDLAREAARKMVKAAKAGEQAAKEIDRAAIEKISAARLSFLDVEESAPAADLPEIPRALDLDVAPVGLTIAETSAPVPAFEV
jgi:hypothetical protein